jgi:hypothetical protein
MSLPAPPAIATPPAAPLGPSVAEAVYTDPAAASAALQEHTRVNGYGIAVESSSKMPVFYRCEKGGKYDNRFKDPTVHESKQRRDTTRAGRKRKAAPNVVENIEQAKLSKRGGKQGGGKRGE